MRFILSFLLSLFLVCAPGRSQTLADYIEAAKRHSPLLHDYENRQALEQSELNRLRALYTHSRLELTGDYLFVPIVAKEDGRSAFKWDAQSASDYYGYDLGEQSGHLHAGLTWTQPLLGGAHYKEAKAQADLRRAQYDHSLRLETLQLERSVTERYLLCLLDQWQTDFADSLARVLQRQREVVDRLARRGLAREADVRLIDIELTANNESRAAARQSLLNHLTDLRLLCGLTDTVQAPLPDVILPLTARQTDRAASLFTEQFRLDSMQTETDLRQFRLQYKPRLDLFATGGLQTGAWAGLERHLGWSAGLTFAWTLADGHQRRFREEQARLRQVTTARYRDYAEMERTQRQEQARQELRLYEERAEGLRRQISTYDEVLRGYEREIAMGQLSIIDYLTVLRQRVEAARQLRELHTNSQLATLAYNYWNR